MSRLARAEEPVRRLARLVGLDVRRYRPERTPGGRLVRLLRTQGVNCVLDIGANTGQYASALRQHGYLGAIVSIEPLSQAWHQLQRRAARDALWTVAPRCAVGASEEEREFHISENSVSSSLHRILETHIDAEPRSRHVDSEIVTVTTLDAIAERYLDTSTVPFLKLDIQGHEDQALASATAALPRLVGIQLELSLTPLYEGQQLYKPLVEDLERAGFEIWNLVPGFADPATGRLLQFDAIFFRPVSP